MKTFTLLPPHKGRVFIMLSSTIFLLGTSELRVIEGYSTQQRKSYLCRVMLFSYTVAFAKRCRMLTEEERQGGG